MTARSLPLLLVLLWLVGCALRMPILAVPPVIPALRGEFDLSGTEIGILTGLPVILFAAAALLGSRLVSRLGAVAAAVSGLVLAGLGCALRGLSADVVTLFAATIVMGAGVAVTQPAAPALVGRWLPHRIGLGTGVYTNGFLVGEILPVALFPVVFPLLGSSWRATFLFWAAPVLAIAVLLLALAPREAEVGVQPSARWWPDWRPGDILRVGSIFAASSGIYFASNAFLPSYLNEAGRPDLISPALTALNLGQLPASLLLIGFGRRLERKVWPFVAAGAICLVALGVIAATANVFTVATAAILGFAAGFSFALALTLPPLMSTPREVARVSGAMFTIGYSGAVLISVLSGAAWDALGAARYAFAPIALSALALMVVVLTIDLARKPDAGVGEARSGQA
jgi:MFS transporter, CP family, cyanate transporter